MRPFSLFSLTSRRSKPQDSPSTRSSRRTSYLSTSTTRSDASEEITLTLPNLPPPSYTLNDCASSSSSSGIAEELEDDNMAWGPPRPAHRPKRKNTDITVHHRHHHSDKNMEAQRDVKSHQ
ncbi:hypothetical protein BC629DRAFT_1437415 [Irpex lacteus]|nr:hypothetical protein BC629DRAFT_1437415 [Irpex lacteus]